MRLHDLSQSASAALGSALGELFWYALMASAAYLLFYVALRARLRRRRVSPGSPTHGQVRREVAHSLRSIAVFGVVTLAVVVAARAGLTRLYGRVEEYGWGWFFASIGVMVVLHDAYFYWTHRLMHHRRLYRLVHRTHHLSTSPTPWAAYAFGPVEALVQAGIGPLIGFTLPTHPAAFASFMVWQITFNVLGHCGYEIFPAWFLRTPLGWVLNSVTHHAQHHEKFRANYGLYFNVWDRLMGTNHRDYERRFEQATSRPQPEATDPTAAPFLVASSTSPQAAQDRTAVVDGVINGLHGQALTALQAKHDAPCLGGCGSDTLAYEGAGKSDMDERIQAVAGQCLFVPFRPKSTP